MTDCEDCGAKDDEIADLERQLKIAKDEVRDAEQRIVELTVALEAAKTALDEAATGADDLNTNARSAVRDIERVL